MSVPSMHARHPLHGGLMLKHEGCAGPMGQCHPMPDDAKLKAEMRRHARNAYRIHSSYNLPYAVEPGSDMENAIRLDQAQRAHDEGLYEAEQEAEQRRLARFARLQQKRAGGMRVSAQKPSSNQEMTCIRVQTPQGILLLAGARLACTGHLRILAICQHQDCLWPQTAEDCLSHCAHITYRSWCHARAGMHGI